MKLLTLKCPECGASVGIEEGDTSCHCPYCQTLLFLDNGKRVVTLNQNIRYIRRNIDDAAIIREKENARENQRSWVALFLSILLLIGGPLFFIMHDEAEQKANQDAEKIQAGSAEDLIGKDYKTVQAHFESAGFNSIKLIDLHDSGLLFWRHEKVESISIGGQTDFTKSDWFDPNSVVVISYH